MEIPLLSFLELTTGMTSGRKNSPAVMMRTGNHAQKRAELVVEEEPANERLEGLLCPAYAPKNLRHIIYLWVIFGFKTHTAGVCSLFICTINCRR